PYVGSLFRFRTQTRTKTELLVILTPHIVRSQLERERILAEEARRIDWIMGDVIKTHGTAGMAPILSPPPGAAAGPSGFTPDPSRWPGIACPPSTLPGAALSAPAVQETAPRTVPGPQSQSLPSMAAPVAAAIPDNGLVAPVE